MNNNYKKLTIVAGLCFVVGVSYYGWHREWFAFRTPLWPSPTLPKSPTYTKYKATLFAWRNQQWVKEFSEILRSESEAENAKILLQTLLNFLHEEKILAKKVTVECVMAEITGQELIVCLDKNPLSKQMATYDKIMVMNGILKTLKENDIKRPLIRFLVNHQPMNDTHLDFSVAWPLEGFA